MSGSWAHSTRRARLPPDWHKIRARTYRNAGGRCEWVTDGRRCTTIAPLHRQGDTPGGHADHITAMTDDHEQTQWLCAPHHLAKSSAEGNAAKPRERRPPEQHPGLT